RGPALDGRPAGPGQDPSLARARRPRPQAARRQIEVRTGFASSIETQALPGCTRRWIIAGSRPFLFALLGLAFALGAAGCGPFVDQSNLQDRADEPAGDLGSGGSVAERFVARCDGLTAVDVQLAVYPSLPRQNGQITIALRPVGTNDEPGAPLETA